jgi:hypothetical protein
MQGNNKTQNIAICKNIEVVENQICKQGRSFTAVAKEEKSITDTKAHERLLRQIPVEHQEDSGIIVERRGVDSGGYCCIVVE